MTTAKKVEKLNEILNLTNLVNERLKRTNELIDVLELKFKLAERVIAAARPFKDHNHCAHDPIDYYAHLDLLAALQAWDAEEGR
jgi:hypothetical protein